MESVPVKFDMQRNGCSCGFYVMGAMCVASGTEKSMLKIKVLTDDVIARGMEALRSDL